MLLNRNNVPRKNDKTKCSMRYCETIKNFQYQRLGEEKVTTRCKFHCHIFRIQVACCNISAISYYFFYHVVVILWRLVCILNGTSAVSWWRHGMETFSAWLALCAGNSSVTGEFPSQRPATRSFAVFFQLRLNKWLNKQWWGWWFETPSCPLWCHCNILMQYHQSIMRFCVSLFDGT